MNEAARFYEEHREGLGQDFLTEIEKSITSITLRPNAGTKVGSRFRRRILPRFPFGIVYSIERDRVIVVAVMHLRRRPGYWKARAR